MQIFTCTFVIKLQYVKRIKPLKYNPSPTQTFEAILRGGKNQLIATGSCKPSLLNDIAWFNEKFQLKSDIALNPQTKQYNPLNIVLDIKCSLQSSIKHSKQLNLSQIAQKRFVPEKEYQLSGGLIVCLELSCVEMQRRGFRSPRKGILKSPQRSAEKPKKQGFLLQRVTFGQQQKKIDTPQFLKRNSHQMQASLSNDPLDLDSLGLQLKATRVQLQKEIQEHLQTKGKLKSIKELLEKQYNDNRELNYAISTLSKKIQEEQRSKQQLQSHIVQTENLCTSLSASLSSKETEIIDLQELLDDLGEKMMQLKKKSQMFQHTQRMKGELQVQVNGLKKDLQQSKLSLTRQYLQEKELIKQLQKVRNENIRLNKLNQQHQKQHQQSIQLSKESKALIVKLTQERDTIKRQTTQWRAEFRAQSQRKDEEINQLQQQYRQIFTRYSEVHKQQSLREKMVEQDMIDNLKKEYQKKIEHYEQRQGKLRDYIEIIDEQTFNLQQMLQQKEQNQAILLQSISKLKMEVDKFTATNNWWEAILQKDQTSHTQNDFDEKALMTKNKQLTEILHRNSFLILQGEKTKIELSALRREHDKQIEKASMIQQQYKQMRQRVSNLYKQNKKLQQKNYLLNKQKQSLMKKNTWLEEQIKQSKKTQKEARKDYQIVSFYLNQIENQKKKQESELQNLANRLSVNNQRSEEQLLSSHKFVKETSIKQTVTLDQEIQTQAQICQELTILLQQRSKESHQVRTQIIKMLSRQSAINKQSLMNVMNEIKVLAAKTKVALIRCGVLELIGDWQQRVRWLEGEIEQIINIY